MNKKQDKNQSSTVDLNTPRFTKDNEWDVKVEGGFQDRGLKFRANCNNGRVASFNVASLNFPLLFAPYTEVGVNLEKIFKDQEEEAWVISRFSNLTLEEIVETAKIRSLLKLGDGLSD